MKYFKIILFTFVLLNFYNLSFSSEIYFIDMKKILNESKAGKKAQTFLKKKFESENKKFEKEGTDLKKKETDLIAKRKLVSQEEYKKELNSLREKSVSYQKRKRQASNEWVKKKNEARAKIIEALTPILQQYMSDNNIQTLLDKKDILLADSKLDLTEKILKILDKQVQSIQLK